MPRLRLVLLALIPLLVAAACGASSATPIPTTTGGPPTPLPTVAAPSPAPTAPSILTPPATPSPTPVVALPHLADVAFEYVKNLTEDLGSRQSATDLELAAAEFISAELEAMGYEVEIRNFLVDRFSRDRPWLIIASPDEEVLESNFLGLTGTAEVVASLVFVELGYEEDFPEGGLEGKIALIRRGELTFEVKVRNAQAAGASAVVIYNNEPDNFRGTLAAQGDIPALSITQRDGLHLLDLLGEGEVVLDVRLVMESVDSRNVIATKPGDESKTVVVGAHFDTIIDTVGANDNASGTAVLLAIARELQDEELPITVKFIAFGSEELGLLGSINYVRSLDPGELAGTIAMINLDTIGSGGSLAAGGAQSLVADSLRLASEMGIDLRPGREPDNASSDHAVFARAGIDTLFFLGRDFSRIHSADDTIQFVEPQMLGDAANLSIAIIRAIASQ
ncbi:MAG: M28 family peptidase [Chloroflexi bacterium]|nr:M28 family peptidase [Chloroflexota bacterium]